MNWREGCMDWEEIEDAAKKMFKVWVGGGELEWANECWGHLTARGLTKNSTVLLETETQLRLVTLAWVYLDFCYFNWDEGYYEDDRTIGYTAEHLEINPLAVGILAGAADKSHFDDVDDPDKMLEYALLMMTRKLRGEIFDCLVSAYGSETELYLAMSRTCKSPQEEFDEDRDLEVTGHNLRGFEYVSNGFQE